MKSCATQVTLKLAAYFLSLTLCACACWAQNTSTSAPPPPAPPPRPQFFAGTITEISTDQITISRTLVGHQPETRTFQLNAKTKLNRNNCKVNIKVTVRYQRLPEGDIALQVLVHPGAKPKHP